MAAILGSFTSECMSRSWALEAGMTKSHTGVGQKSTLVFRLPSGLFHLRFLFLETDTETDSWTLNGFSFFKLRI